MTASGRRREPTFLLCSGLAWSAGLIHLQAAADHLDEYAPYAACFIALALLQLAWGTLLYRRPSRRLLAAGALAGLPVVAVWVLSRTTGLPVGPAAGGPESIGLLDAIATLDELVVFALAGASFLTGAWSRFHTALRAGALLSIFLTSLVLGGGIHAH